MRLTDEQQTCVELFTAGVDVAIEAGAGCLTGDTILHLNRGGKGFRYTIEQLVRQFSGNPLMTRRLNGREVTQRARRWDLSMPTFVARADGDVIRLGRVSEAWCSGEKAVYEMRTAAGRSVRATADHPVLDADGEWQRLGALDVGSIIRVNDGRSQRARAAKRMYRYVSTRFHPYQVNDSNRRVKTKIPRHRAIIEAEMNGLSLDDYLHVLRSDAYMAAQLTYLDPVVHVHHKDENTLNNTRTNLTVLDPSVHHRLHAQDGAGNNVLWQVGRDTVIDVELIGTRMTYDIEVADEPHNFLADDVVVHNTGKTSTLKAMGESDRRKRSQYVAFNRAIVLDAAEKMPRNVRARTAHSIAKRAVGYRYDHRLGAARVRSYELGQLLGVDPLPVRKPDGSIKVLQPGYLASIVMKAVVNFCYTADELPLKQHVPYVEGIDGLGVDGRRLWDNNNALRAHVEPYLTAAWADVCNPDGRLPFKHDHYLKIYERSEPHIPADALLLDEAQDLSPVMISIAAQQTHAQRILVGDSQQQIYSWRGAVNALASIDSEATAFLSQSFRFGQAIADVANVLLDGLDAELRLRGTPEIRSFVGRVDEPRCILTRTNAAAMRNVLYALSAGTSVHLVGDGEEIERFARAVIDLQTDGQTDYHDLACFASWGEVLEYVADDPSGDDLTLMVRLIEEYGPRRILDAMRRSSSEETAELVVSTAHKSKGREWSTVRLEDDFREASPVESPEEWRLLYVAVTRAQVGLDVSDCTPLTKMGIT